MKNVAARLHGWWRQPWGLFLTLALVASLLGGVSLPPVAQAEGPSGPTQFDQGVDPQEFLLEHEIERTWRPDYVGLATGDASLLDAHGVYAWPFDVSFTLGHAIQSYQDYGGTPYFHHGIDIMAPNGTDVFNRSGGQVVNVENYQPGNDLYWEVAVLDPDGYIWQYHHIDKNTIPQYIKDKFAEYQADPVNGGFIPPDTYIGDIVYWTVVSFGKRFNHIHLNILGAGAAYINGFEFHTPLADTVGPEIQGVGLLQSDAIVSGNEVEGSYSLYVHARDLVLDDVYYLPPYEVTFSVDCGPTQTTWRFDNLPGGADDEAYVSDFYVSPTCGNYSCREFYIDLGFVKDSQYVFPPAGGQHTVVVTVRDYAGNSASQSYTYSVIGPPVGTTVWFDDFETDLGWVRNPNGSDTATTGLWERANPEATSSSGTKQMGTTVSGSYDLVTGPLAGSSAGSYDIDGGVTSMRSPDIELPSEGDVTLSFYYYLAHGSNSSTADYLRVKVVGSTTTTVFEELGAANDDDAAWALQYVSLNAFAGQTVYVLVEAADDSGASLVEAALDDVHIIHGSNTNQAPTAYAQAVSTAEDTALGIVLTGCDPENAALTFTIVSGPSHGTLSGTAPNLTYTPAADYNGTDSLTFVVNDGQVDSAPAMVSITVSPVNDAPLANPQSVQTAQDTPVAITLTGSDVDGDALAFEVVEGPSHGTLSGTAPDLTYTPGSAYLGSDSFTFVVNDGQMDSAPATVEITAQPTAVELLWFEATGQAGYIQLGWETASELDNLGFNLYRAVKPDGSRTQVNEDWIPSQVPPGSPVGALYGYADMPPRRERTYYYWLEVVDIYGHSALHGPVQARTN